MKITYLQQHVNDRLGMVVPYYDMEVGEIGECGPHKFKKCADGRIDITWPGQSHWSIWVTHLAVKSARRNRNHSSIICTIIEVDTI